MARRRKRSRKRSVANSTARQLERAVFFLDESIYSRVLTQALREAGANVEHPGLGQAVPFGAADIDWLAKAGNHRWIVLSRDQRVRQRPLERQVLIEAGVAAFIYTGGQASADDTCRALLKALRKILNISASERRPFLYAISCNGSLSRLEIGRPRRR